MEKRRVVITGLGTVNPLGNNTADSWAAAKAGKCGIGPITRGTGGHPLWSEGHVHLPGDGLRRRHQCRRRCLPPHP